MTENQITESLGRPPGEYTSEGHLGYIFRGRIGDPRQDPTWWIGEDCAVLVWFDPNGKASTIHQIGPLRY